MKKILLIIIFNSFVFADFTRDDSAEIVTDSTTNLQWQDQIRATSDATPWLDAIDYCQELILNGHGDWRLPNINELHSLVDDTRHTPSISPVFHHVSIDKYWSSTTYDKHRYNAWAIDFSAGSVLPFNSKINQRYVRCVRTN